MPFFWNEPWTPLLSGDLCGSCTVTSWIICKLPMNHVCKRVWYGANSLARSEYMDPTLCSRGASAVPSSQCRGLISMQRVRDMWWMGSASPSHVFRALQAGQNLPDDHSGEGIRNISVNITPPHPHKIYLVCAWMLQNPCSGLQDVAGHYLSCVPAGFISGWSERKS